MKRFEPCPECLKQLDDIHAANLDLPHMTLPDDAQPAVIRLRPQDVRAVEEAAARESEESEAHYNTETARVDRVKFIRFASIQLAAAACDSDPEVVVQLAEKLAEKLDERGWGENAERWRQRKPGDKKCDERPPST